jgi:hypothetical protein
MNTSRHLSQAGIVGRRDEIGKLLIYSMEYATFDTITVRQYQQLYAIHTSKDEPEDKIIQSVCVLTGKSEKGVEEMLLPEFNRVSAEIARIFSKDIKGDPQTFIQVAGKRYGIIYDPATLSTGQYVSIQTWISTNVIENLHRIMASLVYQVKGWGIFKKRMPYNSDNHAQLSEAILDCKFIDVHSSCVFFLELWKNSINSLEDYLVREAVSRGSNRMKIQDTLRKISDGFTIQKKSPTSKM